MRITKLKIRNYKSFHESPELEFTSGFNIIAGQNNTGKTALLEALSLNFGANPHRSLKTVPTRDTIVDPASSVDVSVTIRRDELLSILAAGGAPYFIALPTYPSDFSQACGYANNEHENVRRLVEYVLAKEEQTFKWRLVRGGQQEGWHPLQVPSNGLYEAQGDQNQRMVGNFAVDRERRIQNIGSTTVSKGDTGEFGIHVIGALSSRIFRFFAERLNVATCRAGTNSSLAPNANNLAEVLGLLQQNPVQFVEYNELVRQVLPQVQQITVRTIGADTLQIVVWAHDPRSKREDIAIPLDQSGTGIGQVLAMLYVAVHSPFPRVIAIDEPQSFLHPGAARKLIDVLSNHPQHQFIVSTHAPTVISAADPETITVTRLESAETKVEQVPPGDRKALQSFLGEIGAHLSDVFGADNVLWVEGTTEEICFPLILRKIANKRLMGTEIVAVRRTGDLESKDAARVFEIYDSLTASNSLIPPAIGFIFDTECRTEKELQDIKKRSKDLAVFLPRRMYENYLLNPAAVAHVASAVEGFRDEPITAKEVSAAIEAKRKDRNYYCSADPKEMSDEQWIKRIDSAKILSDIFGELSENRVSYNKVIHSVELTRWLVEHSPEELRAVADFLARVLARKKESEIGNKRLNEG